MSEQIKREGICYGGGPFDGKPVTWWKGETIPMTVRGADNEVRRDTYYQWENGKWRYVEPEAK